MKHERWGTRRPRRRGTAAHESAPSFSSLASLAAAAGVEDDETVQNLLGAVQATHDSEIAWDAYELIENLAYERWASGDPFYPSVTAEEVQGEFEIGVAEFSGCPVGIRPDEAVQHTLFLGRSGSGKTTAMRRLFREVISKGPSMQPPVHLLVFDIKNDYDVLARDFPGIWRFAVPGPDFRFNVLEPPGCGVGEWCGQFAETFANSAGFYAAQGTVNLLDRLLRELYARYDTAHGQFPCLLDLHDFLVSLKAGKKVERYSEEYHWFERILSRVESYASALGETVNCSRGFDLGEILAHHTILSLRAVRGDAASLLTEVFLAQAVQWRMARGERGGRLRNVCGFDEGKHLFPRYREETGQGINNMSNLIANARDVGLGLAVADCDPSLLANSIKS